MKLFKKVFACMVAGIILLATLCACNPDKNVILTTGLKNDEIFKIEKSVCTKGEMMLYLTNMQNSYEKVYGEEIWSTNTEGTSIQESLKETVLARISRIKVMNLLADERGISLTKEEEEKAAKAGKIYFDSLNEKEIEVMGIEEETVVSAYKEYAIANKLYGYLIQDVNPEISDDEARTVTVTHIFIKTYYTDENGKRTEYSDSLQMEAYKRAKLIYQEYADGASFDSLIRSYNEAGYEEHSYRRGEMDAAYEEAAFSLATNEVSNVVETPDGYYIIKCLNTFNRSETDANKKIILEEMRKESFEQTYEEFLGTLTGNLNKDVWEELTLPNDPEVTTDSFFTTYELYFEEKPLETN